jgi:hypothetical protein
MEENLKVRGMTLLLPSGLCPEGICAHKENSIEFFWAVAYLFVA